ncbi:hypothetical protein ABIB82_007777 [Bradyrhizobium sp. i1.8.4]
MRIVARYATPATFFNSEQAAMGFYTSQAIHCFGDGEQGRANSRNE